MIKKNIDITDYSNFHTKAIAKNFYEFNWDIKELKIILKKFKNYKKLFISWWTNLLFAFNVFNWLVIKFNDYKLNTNYNYNWYKSYFWNAIKWKFILKDNILEISGFEYISNIAEILFRENLSYTWKRFIWLPWTIAWAVVWNAWCFWLEIMNTFLKAEVLDLEDLELKIISKEHTNFSYRNSIFKTWKFIILKVWFNLSSKEEKYWFTWKVLDIINFRKNIQPKWFSCWSFFKNPSKDNSAWKLIELVWLKWYKIWWAYFSGKHANFLMSDWTAKWEDLISLKNLAQRKVKTEFKIELIPEVNIIYNN